MLSKLSKVLLTYSVSPTSYMPQSPHTDHRSFNCSVSLTIFNLTSSQTIYSTSQSRPYFLSHLPSIYSSTPHRTLDRQIHAHPSRHSTRSLIRSLPQHLIFLCIRTTLGHIPHTLYTAHQLLSIPSASFGYQQVSISDGSPQKMASSVGDSRKRYRIPLE